LKIFVVPGGSGPYLGPGPEADRGPGPEALASPSLMDDDPTLYI